MKKDRNEIEYKLRLSKQITKDFNKLLQRIRSTKRRMDYAYTVNDIISICNKRIDFEKFKTSFLKKELTELEKINDDDFKRNFEEKYIYNTGELYEEEIHR